MTAQILDGKAAASQIKGELAVRLKRGLLCKFIVRYALSLRPPFR